MAINTPSQSSLELWAGLECTVNRVGDTLHDQVERTGHAFRLEDLDLFAGLGIKALRYPVLWERTAPHGVEQADWSWTDERLARLRELRLRPIVGLVHHGSGPRFTHLNSPVFAPELARFARAVAERYPWVEDYTPVNEPLTTARFSGLYGHWYPHRRDDLSFARALLNQCRAVVLAMVAIRQVNPAARLVQTDDLGKTFSSPALAYQADFENERRWVTFDLLCGRLNRDHPLWDYLRWVGIQEAELAWFLDHPCPPDILGFNYYLTSERFLDDRLNHYPASMVKGNGRHRYVDVEAVRVRAAGLDGPRVLLAEAWERYGRPLAVTEVHNGCTREEQLRWFMEVWQAAQELRQEGVDVRALTAWALLGTYDWNSLVTRSAGHYEPGIFDVRAPQPRPTALAGLLSALAEDREPDHPVLAAPGWWRRPLRLLYPETVSTGLSHTTAPMEAQPAAPVSSPRPVLITGANGTLGRAFTRLCELRGLPHYSLTRAELDITEPAAVDCILDELQPWAVVNAAGFVRVDEAELQPDRCYRENTDGPAVLAAVCAAREVQLLTFSSHLVFDGQQEAPYMESDAVSPLNTYGASKAEAERQVLDTLDTALVVRTSPFFGPWDGTNFVTRAVQTLSVEGHFTAAADATISPTYIPDLVHACLDLLIDGERGLWHLSNQGAVTWADLAREGAERAGYPAQQVAGYPLEALGLAAPRPRYSVLGSERGLLLPSLDNALDRYFDGYGGSG